MNERDVGPRSPPAGPIVPASSPPMAPPAAPAPVFTITFRAAPRGPDRFGREPVYRLKLLLKHALRALGLRAVSVQQSGRRRRNGRTTRKVG